MDNDDRPVGRVLSRREALVVLGAISAAALAACSPVATATTAPAATAAPATLVPTIAPTSAATTTGATTAATAAATVAAAATATTAITSAAMCVVRPALTEGPYFVDEKLNRSDIRSNPSDGSVREGMPLVLTVNLYSITNNCTALSGATVDVWHCDAAGQYSDVTDRGFSTKGQKFLRGYQTSDANGQVAFTTIYPGWYSGRAVHIHFKIRTSSGHEFTSQWFFDDSLSDTVFSQAPYAARGTRNTRNSDDGIYSGGGNQLVLAPTLTGGTYSASFDIGLQFA